MPTENILGPTIDSLLSDEAKNKIKNGLEIMTNLQQKLVSLIRDDDGRRLDLLRMGTVFQLFFIDTLASGKQPNELTNDDWKGIAGQVYKHTVLEDEQKYSKFIFSLYADYVDISADTLKEIISEKNYEAIKDLSKTLRENTEKLDKKEITEIAYIEAGLWVSLEAMIKLLACSFTAGLKEEYANLIQSSAQFAFEYGRYVLFSKEQAILERYIENQKVLDDELREDYESYLREVQEQAASFQKLIDEAFSANIRESLMQSAALARAAGVDEDEILDSVDDVDAFFMG